MNNQFDELTKSLAQSVTRRVALKNLGVGLAGMVLACFGLANKAEAAKCVASGGHCTRNQDCCTRYCRPDNTCGCRSDDECGREGKGYVCLLSYGYCGPGGVPCSTNADCPTREVCCNGTCVAGIPDWCDRNVDPCCCYCIGSGIGMATALTPCDVNYNYCRGRCGAQLLC
jgi:hypothetical protein